MLLLTKTSHSRTAENPTRLTNTATTRVDNFVVQFPPSIPTHSTSLVASELTSLTTAVAVVDLCREPTRVWLSSHSIPIAFDWDWSLTLPRELPTTIHWLLLS